VHHRIDDSPDDIDMDLDSRFRPSNGPGGRIILLGDGTEVSTSEHDGELFDQEDEDNDLDSQVNKYNKGDSSAQVTESPSSVQTEKSESLELPSKPETSATKPTEK